MVLYVSIFMFLERKLDKKTRKIILKYSETWLNGTRT